VKPNHTASDTNAAPSLSFSRAYSLALSPQLVYARSELLHALVSSKVHQQLEFLAVGSWWVYSSGAADLLGSSSERVGAGEAAARPPQLFKVPSSREDIFSDRVLDFKAKRALTKFLRFIVEYEDQSEVWEQHKDKPFATFLAEQFKVPETLHPPLLALSLSTDGPSATSTQFALMRIARHLRSIGVFGAGFGAVIPKWGGMSEVAQVACRACAVGGGVYVLGRGVAEVSSSVDGAQSAEAADSGRPAGIKVQLKGGEVVTTGWVISQGSQARFPGSAAAEEGSARFCKSITVVSSSLVPLFPPIAEEAPPPACAVVAFPSGSLIPEGGSQEHELPPVYVLVHSADTGECAAGQSKYHNLSETCISIFHDDQHFEYLSTLSEQH
jgi:Rab proteins geranylgeranyltransferase component A